MVGFTACVRQHSVWCRIMKEKDLVEKQGVDGKILSYRSEMGV
jgi:hypothetical protein